MAEVDYSFLTDGLDSNTVVRGVTNGIARPPGGGNFLFGFNSKLAAAGAVGLYVNLVNFAPMAKGASIRGVVQRGPGGGAEGFSPFLFAGLQGPSVNDQGYKLGLSDEDPHKVVLRKGSVINGIPAVAETSGLLRQSTGTYLQGIWVHLRLDMIVNLSGDVILQVFENDLNVNPIGVAPDWQPIAGMDSFVDDVLGVNSGSLPFTSGFGGFAFATEQVTRRGYFDHIELLRQT